MTAAPVLQVRDLQVSYSTERGPVHAVNGLSLDVHAGESLGLVGESGSGKTTVALALMRVLPENGRITRGQAILDGVDLLAISEDEMNAQRWKNVSMIFQAAMNSLNPLYHVADQIIEAMQAHETPGEAHGGERGKGVFAALTGVRAKVAAQTGSHKRARERVKELFALVGLDEGLMDRYPHEYSGGMRQRAVIAQALVCSPRLVIADEPTTALDVLVQDLILKELRRIQAERSMAMIYISHDIGVIAEMSDSVGVMYGGTLVELGPVDEVFASPRHPYTSGLLASVPSVVGERRPLAMLPGEPPDLAGLPPGCPFAPRCPRALERCGRDLPAQEGPVRHWFRCWNPVPEKAQ